MQLTSADGTTIGYETLGSGSAVVGIDGAMCYRDHGPMRPIAEALADAHTVALYDRRGRGASGDSEPYSVQREIEDVDALIDAVGAPAALFGISSGGALALRAAAALGHRRVSAVAVFEPPFMLAAALGGAAEYTKALSAALQRDDRDAAVTAFLGRVGMPPEAIAGARQSPGWAALTALAPTLGYDDQVMDGSRVPAELLASLAVPVLAVAGGRSPDFLQHGARSVAEAVQHGRFELLEGQGHDVGAQAIAPVLLEFLE